MVKTVVEDLVRDLQEAFQDARARGEIGWKHQSGESFSHLDERVRAAVLGAVKTPEAFNKYLFFNDEHYVSMDAAIGRPASLRDAAQLPPRAAPPAVAPRITHLNCSSSSRPPLAPCPCPPFHDPVCTGAEPGVPRREL